MFFKSGVGGQSFVGSRRTRGNLKYDDETLYRGLDMVPGPNGSLTGNICRRFLPGHVVVLPVTIDGYVVCVRECGGFDGTEPTVIDS